MPGDRVMVRPITKKNVQGDRRELPFPAEGGAREAACG